MDIRGLPSAIQSRIQDLPYTSDTVGMSASQVLIFPDRVLKMGLYSPYTEGMVHLMRWLQGRLPVPQILGYEVKDAQEYLLMSRIPGKMACDEEYLSNPDQLLPLLAQALHTLWQVDIEGCPRTRYLEEELREAGRRLDAGISDKEYLSSLAENEGFESPEKLLHWLEGNRPSLEPAFSHGDCCLPNIFFDRDQVSGFIDLGDAGIADRWRDISLCYRSLKHNTNGAYGFVLPGFRPERLFDHLGIVPDWDKLRYYILLDAFFN